MTSVWTSADRFMEHVQKSVQQNNGKTYKLPVRLTTVANLLYCAPTSIGSSCHHVATIDVPWRNFVSLGKVQEGSTLILTYLLIYYLSLDTWSHIMLTHISPHSIQPQCCFYLSYCLSEMVFSVFLYCRQTILMGLMFVDFIFIS